MGSLGHHITSEVFCAGAGVGAVPQVLTAFSEWLKLASVESLDGAQLAEHPLVTAALEGLNKPDTFDGAVDAVVELVYLSSAGEQPVPGMLPLVARVVPAVGRHALERLCIVPFLPFQGPHWGRPLAGPRAASEGWHEAGSISRSKTSTECCATGFLSQGCKGIGDVGRRANALGRAWS
jgi:hypothetical protein